MLKYGMVTQHYFLKREILKWRALKLEGPMPNMTVDLLEACSL